MADMKNKGLNVLLYTLPLYLFFFFWSSGIWNFFIFWSNDYLNGQKLNGICKKKVKTSQFPMFFLKKTKKIEMRNTTIVVII